MSEHDSGWLGGTSRRTLLRWGTGIALVLLCAGAALIVTVRSVFDAAMLERHLDAAVAEATDGRYRVRVDTVQWGFWARSLRLGGVTLRPDAQAGPGAPSESPLPRRLYLSIPRLDLQGLGLWALLWHRVLQFNEVLVQRPRMAIKRRGAPARALDTSTVAPSDTTASPGVLADVRVKQLRVKQGTLTRGRVNAVSRDSAWGVGLHLRRLSLDSMRTQSPASYAVRHFAEASIDGYRRRVPGEPYVVRTGAGRVSRRDSTLQLMDLHFRPTVSDEAFVRRHQYRVNRFRTAAEEVTVAGADLRRFVTEGAVHAARVQITGLTLDVYRDNHPPKAPNDSPPPMPQDAVDRLDRSVRIDTLRIQDSRIRYAKRPENVPRIGAIAFNDLWASAYNLTTNPQRMSPSTPAVVEARTRVNGAGRLQATFRIPLRAPHLNFSFQGRLGAMDARAFNETFVPLGGVRIEHGHVDSLWFQADVKRGTATGTLGAVYRNLEIETLDKATGKRGLVQRLKTTVAGMALREENHPSDGALHTGKIEHTRRPDDTFFKFLWHAVRDGIYSLVGIDRLPG